MTTNEKLKTHCDYVMINKITNVERIVTVPYPFTAKRARERCTSDLTEQKDWKVLYKSFY